MSTELVEIREKQPQKCAKIAARPAATKAKMTDGKGRREVRGMIVRGMILNRLFFIPLTNIPLTLDFSGKMTDRGSSRRCALLTHCPAARPAATKKHRLVGARRLAAALHSANGSRSNSGTEPPAL